MVDTVRNIVRDLCLGGHREVESLLLVTDHYLLYADIFRPEDIKQNITYVKDITNHTQYTFVSGLRLVGHHQC